MLIEIEYYRRDTKLYGSRITRGELKEQIRMVEALYDRETDNFIALLCRRYGWTETAASDVPEYTYDRDTGRLWKAACGRRNL